MEWTIYCKSGYEICRVARVETTPRIHNGYSNVFTGNGCFKNPLSLHVTKTRSGAAQEHNKSNTRAIKRDKKTTRTPKTSINEGRQIQGVAQQVFHST